MNILLVDDDLDCLQALQIVVESMDHRCVVADDPRDALEQYALHSFDLVITDFRMPFMNGSELARKMRAINPESKIILVTGYMSIYEVPGESLFLSVLEKPVDTNELKGILDKL